MAFYTWESRVMEGDEERRKGRRDVIKERENEVRDVRKEKDSARAEENATERHKGEKNPTETVRAENHLALS